jgi:hypothetical protein
MRRSPAHTWRVAIIDSGFDPRSGIVPIASCRFVDDGERVTKCAVTADPTGHGTAIAEIIAQSHIELLVAQVMHDGATATPAAVAAAIRWSLELGATLVHLSLGVTNDRPALAGVVKISNEYGALVVASTPARGATTFPAAYPGVLRATGDARCAFNEISLLEDRPLTFGACAAFTTSTGRLMRGASIGAANLARFVALNLSPDAGADADTLAAQLSALAAYRGRERRGHVAEIVNTRTDSTGLSGS